MKRAYLEEDLELIRRYFPGAKAVTLRTPFDFSPKRPLFSAEAFRDEPDERWYGDLLWNR